MNSTTWRHLLFKVIASPTWRVLSQGVPIKKEKKAGRKNPGLPCALVGAAI
jgi:hypothetical protein